MLDGTGSRRVEHRAPEPGEHTVTVEVVAEWDDHERLADLLKALDAHPELLGPAVGADVRQRVMGVTVTVEARTEKAAQEIATLALLDEMQRLGMIGD
jgi:phosphate starvation-inducible protein PhoH